MTKVALFESMGRVKRIFQQIPEQKGSSVVNWVVVSMIFPQQQNAMGSLHNIDFGVFWASWGRSGKEPGSGNRFQVSMGSERRRLSMGSDRFRGPKIDSGNWFRFSMGEVLRRFQVPEIAFPRCCGFEGFGGSGFRWILRFGKWLRFRRFWSSWF